jgi:hypothetical protein
MLRRSVRKLFRQSRFSETPRRILAPRLEPLERREVPAVINVGDPGTTVGEAYGIGSFEDTYVGSMERPDDVDLFIVPLREGQRIAVTVTDTWNQNDRKSGLWPHVIIFSADTTQHLVEGYHQNFKDSFTVGTNKGVKVTGNYYVGISARQNDNYNIVTGVGTVVPPHVTATGEYQLQFRVEGGVVVPPDPLPGPDPQPPRTTDLALEEFEYLVTSDDEKQPNGPVPLGQVFQVTAVVRNNGTAEAGRVAARLFLSTDDVIDPSTDVFIADLGSVAGLARGQSYTFSTQASLPLNLPRTFYGVVRLGVVLDAVNGVTGSTETKTGQRNVQLYDPINPNVVSPRVFRTKAAAERYLASRRFDRPLRFGLDGYLDTGWSKSILSPVFSRYDGMTRASGAFRIQGNVIGGGRRWRVIEQGTLASGEPNPRTALRLRFGAAWASYVKDYHERF